MERSVLGTKSFHLQYDSFQIGNKTRHSDNEIFGNIIFFYQNLWFHCLSEMNHIANENFSFPKPIVQFQKGQIFVFSEMEKFQYFFIRKEIPSIDCYVFKLFYLALCTNFLFDVRKMFPVVSTHDIYVE